MELLLKNLRWHDGRRSRLGDIRISNGIFHEIGDNLAPGKREVVHQFKNHFIYPGLINSHDHLEMNLYPKLGKPPYTNYVEWAKDIYKPHQSPIKEIEKLPIEDRLLWGGLKNLIAGVTTVVHHNPWHRLLGKEKFPIKVLKKIAWAHSLQFGKKIAREFPKRKNTPFVIHAAEGVDAMSFSEISALTDLGLVKNNTVLIHAIALTQKDIDVLSQHQSSVVWCPASNNYMFNQTANIDKLKQNVRVALGSDSTLTGSPTFLDEIHTAAKTGCVTSEEIFAMITTIPAGIFNLPPPIIDLAHPADFFIAPVVKENYLDNLIALEPKDIELVVVNGHSRLANMAYQTEKLKNTINVQGTIKSTDTDVGALKRRIEKKVGGSILVSNPLWNLLSS